MKNKVIHTIILIIFLALILNTSSAEAKINTAELLKLKLNQARSSAGEITQDIRITDEMLKNSDPNEVLEVLAPYENDPEWSVRHMNHLFLVSLANLHPYPKIRQEAAGRLVKATFVSSDRRAGMLLLDFTANDFNDQSKDLIRQALTNVNKGYIGGDISVWLCGVANIQDQLPLLEELLVDEDKYQTDPNMKHGPRWYYTTAWAARLARARMGVKEDINRCIELAESEQDSTQRVLRILPKIGYIRQPEAIKYLQQYLESNKRLPPINPIFPGELYASRAMHILAKSLKNYPVKRKEGRNYTQEEIELCRAWMSKQKHWEIIK